MTDADCSRQVSAVFSGFVCHLEKEADIRDNLRISVKDVEKLSRELIVGLSEIHLSQSASRMPEIYSQAEDRLANIRKVIQELIVKVPLDQYYVFHESWKYVFQKLVLGIALVVYLKECRVATLEEVAQAIGVKSDRKNGFHLDLEDYLFGLLNLASELSRYCVNRVTAGDYKSPEKIFTFISELGSGFRLLNLKNNELRRRFDSLKYDEKKVEEVIYDLSVRGLLNKSSASGAVEEKSADSSSMQE
ncbi:translin-like isoform X2 [Paramacrobiotus metropolitanus]|uniref:translin-like isoform X2 n=1 Tax=Paramacrobiotus metropolitanus TaxID=2943436 RepID=UPI00244627DA|nr:translin-like isoform X2 [Paramacrobiotus metropolitanus]